MINEDQIKKIHNIRTFLRKNSFSVKDRVRIEFQEYKNGINPELVIMRSSGNNTIKVSGVKLEDVTFLIHFRDDMEALLDFFEQVSAEKDLKGKCISFVNSDEFQLIRWRDDFASKSPWKYSLEGRDHLGGDSVIFTEDGENIYFSGISDIEQDFIAQSRNYLSELINMIVEICGTKHKGFNYGSKEDIKQ